MTRGRPGRTILSIITDVLMVVAVIETVRLVVMFFGGLSATDLGTTFIALTDRITLPLGLSPIKTPNGGVFDLDTVATIGAIVAVEWLLTLGRSRAQ